MTKDFNLTTERCLSPKFFVTEAFVFNLFWWQFVTKLSLIYEDKTIMNNHKKMVEDRSLNFTIEILVINWWRLFKKLKKVVMWPAVGHVRVLAVGHMNTVAVGTQGMRGIAMAVWWDSGGGCEGGRGQVNLTFLFITEIFGDKFINHLFLTPKRGVSFVINLLIVTEMFGNIFMKAATLLFSWQNYSVIDFWHKKRCQFGNKLVCRRNILYPFVDRSVTILWKEWHQYFSLFKDKFFCHHIFVKRFIFH